MKLTPVIAALRARCPYFENRVAGAAQFKNLPEVGKLRLPAAYVVPGDDSPGENKSQTDYWQELKEGFSVVVILSNGRDERGQFASYDVVDDVRQMLFKTLLGWKPRRRISSARVRTVLPVVTPRPARLPPIWMMTTLTCCRRSFAAWWRHPVPAWRRGGTTSCLPRFVRCC